MGIFSNYNKNNSSNTKSLNEFYISLLEQIGQNELSWNFEPILEDAKEELAYVDSIISSLSETEKNFLGPRWFYYNSQYRFIYTDDDNKPIGFIEVRIIKKRCNLNVAVNPSYRGKGMAHKLISKALEDVQYILIGSKIFVAVINPANKQSISLVKELGFKQMKKIENGYLVFELEDKHTVREGIDNMGIYSNKTRFIQELKIDGKKVKDDEEDFNLDPDKTKESNNKDDQPVEDKSTDDTTNTEDEEDYKIPDDEETDESEDGSNEETDDNTEGENPEDNPTDGTDGETDNGSDGGSDDEDFKLEEPDETDDNTEETEDEADETSDVTDGKSEIQSLEDNLFKDLTPEQMSIKQIELKQQYIDLFDSISDIISRVNKVTKTTDNANIIEFVTNKMSELKDLVHFYLNNTYATKSYIENTMNYQQYILILNTINKMLKEIIPKTGKSN